MDGGYALRCRALHGHQFLASVRCTPMKCVPAQQKLQPLYEQEKLAGSETFLWTEK